MWSVTRRELDVFRCCSQGHEVLFLEAALVMVRVLYLMDPAACLFYGF